MLSIQPTSTKTKSFYVRSFTVSSIYDAVEEKSTMAFSKKHPDANSIVCKAQPPRSFTPPRIVENETALPDNFFARLFSALRGQGTTITRKPTAVTAKGVFANQTSAMKADSIKTIDTEATSNQATHCDMTALIENRCPSIGTVWQASTSQDHNKDLPIVIRRPSYDSYNEVDDRKLLKRIMGRAKKLPQNSGKYASNHIMVNAERTRRNVPPLVRDRDLDRVAREHAKLMADSKMVFHISSPSQLQSMILEGTTTDSDRQRLFFPRLGVNIARGKTIEEIHKFMMANLAERNNVCDKRFAMMGMGTARTENGMIYLCQVFGG